MRWRLPFPRQRGHRPRPNGWDDRRVVPLRRRSGRARDRGGFGALVLLSSALVFSIAYAVIPPHWIGGHAQEPPRALALVEAGEGGAAAPRLAEAPVVRRDSMNASFGLCHTGGGRNCVVDGDTFWFEGTKIRVADIDAPETHPPRCDREARLGEEATRELHRLLNAGPFSLESTGRDTDRYGRQLRVVTRDGESLGGALVAQGLARWYDGGRKPWCE